ncbi:MAG: transposase [Sphingomonadales bacterium]|nr:transposase [Sphingomonadales bacterium]
MVQAAVVAAFAAWAANIPSCVIGMEACSTAHHWVRVLASLGHSPKLMAAEVVAPFRMSRGAKNDHNDAEAILVAVQQPTMRFVSPKSIEQQAMLSWHRAGGVPAGAQVAAEPHSRGLLAEFVHLGGQVRGDADPQDAGTGGRAEIA